MSKPKTPPQTIPQIDPRELRNALGGFVTGVTAVTTEVNGKRYGFTANSFSSVSLDPPLILVCIGKRSSNYEIFRHAGHFCVNILSEGQRNISQQFAAKGVDRFAGVDAEVGVLGSPVIKNSVSWFECSLHQRIDAGDHEILIGSVQDFGYTTGSPLGYCRGNYVMFELEQQVMNAHGHRGRFGAILEAPEGIILVQGSRRGTWEIPAAARLGTREEGDGLFGVLSTLGCDFDIEFLFAVWEDDGAANLNVYYRGSAVGRPTLPRADIFSLGNIPFDRLSAYDVRLLRRYADERTNFRFSIYSGTETRGSLLRAHRQEV